MEIQVVYFDLGKVLLDYDWERIVQQISNNGKHTHHGVLQFLIDTGLIVQYEKGEIETENFFHPLMDHLNFDGGLVAFQGLWNNIFTPMEENIEIVRSLYGKYPLGLISNLNDSHMDYVESTYDFLGLFLLKTYSNMVGVRKPDLQIYRGALEGMEVEAGSAVFIDDLEENVKGAREAGMQAIHYRPGIDLKLELRNLGIQLP